MSKATAQARAMTEDELLEGITDALTLAGWHWFHVRRSDRAIVQGRQGWPDLFAVHATRRLTLVLELKTEDGRLESEQGYWFHALAQAGHNPVVIRPGDYDRILSVILDQPVGPAAQLSILGAES